MAGLLRAPARPALRWAALLIAPLLAGCATGAPAVTGPGGTILAVSTINVWGSILGQIGGDKVHAVSIVNNPNLDPHDYEPTPADARAMAVARLVIENGAGYDAWAARLLAANPAPGRRVIDVARLLGVSPGGNPHLWYAPGDVIRVADRITADLTRINPADATYFRQRRHWFLGRGLAAYHRLISRIRRRYAGTPIGASESIVTPLAAALGLRVATPPTFLRAVSEGADPSLADLSTIRSQIAGHRIAVYVYNRQNAIPDVAAQVRQARAVGIPVVAITETLAPAGATFQRWQVTQLRALAAALAQAESR